MSKILHVIDFEGTREAGIREYGVVTLVDWEIVDTCYHNCLGNFLGQIEYFTGLRRNGSFVGHNASVEDRLLRHYAASPGYVKRTSESADQVSTWAPWIDTKVLYKNFFQSVSDFSLKSLIDQFGMRANLFSLAGKFCEYSNIGYHNPLFDALATSLLLQNIIKTSPDLSIDALIEYSQQSRLL